MFDVSERTFSVKDFNDFIKEKIDLFIFSDAYDERGLFFQCNIRDCSQRFLVIRYDFEGETYSINGGPFKQIRQDLFDDLTELLQGNSNNIFIDITSMPVPLMFNILKIIREIKCGKVFCGYTKPKTYKVRNAEIETERYDLTERFIGIKSIPGFLRSSYVDREKLLIMFLGFEGKRATYIFQEVGPGPNSTIPIIGFPAFCAGWHNITFEMNIQLLLEEPYMHHYLKYVSADSPFEAYSLLVRLKNKYPDRDIIIAPLGVKTHALGTALYSLKDEECIIMYDNPIESKERSEHVDFGLIYDITYLLEE